MDKELVQNRPEPFYDGPKGVCKGREKERRVEVLKQHQIILNFVDVGCTVSVGCKNICFSSIEETMKAVNAYVNDPVTEKEKWYEIFNKDV